MHSRLSHYTVIFLLVFFLFGCSSTRLAYNYLDWIISWNLDDYISLDNEQDDWFDQHLDAFLKWHRKDQLPSYIEFIEQFQKDAERKLTEEIFKQRFETIEDFLRDIMVRAEPDISHLLMLLTREQAEEFFKNVEKQQKELEKRILGTSDKKREKERIKRTKKMIERFVGKLNSEQEKEITNWVDELIPSYELWMESRRIWQEKLKDVIIGNEAGTDQREQLRNLIIDFESLWSAEYRNVLEQNRLNTFRLLIRIHSRLSEKQKHRLQKKLEDLKEDLEYLSQKD